jgi:hypothetical protein
MLILAAHCKKEQLCRRKKQLRTLLVGYDLNKPMQNYADLIAALRELPGYWHHLDSTWIVRAEMTAAELRDLLRAKIDTNDELLVIDVTSDSWATQGINQEGVDWLHKFASGTAAAVR